MVQETTRPQIPTELLDEINGLVTEHCRVPANRLTTADRLRILVEEYRSLQDEVEDLEEQLGGVHAQDTKLSQIDSVESGGIGDSPSGIPRSEHNSVSGR